MTNQGILIVEDSYIVAYHLQKTLESEGYKVLKIIDSGEGALDFLTTNQPDVILMDIMLKGQLDGVATAGLIKSKFNIPLIYITALTDKETIQRAKITEPYGYLTKPFEDREIFTVIEMALYKHDIEMRLKQSEERYFNTVKSISDALIIIDKEYFIRYINPEAERLLNVTLEHAMGENLLDVVTLNDSETGEVNVNPIQCPLDAASNVMPDNLLLVSSEREIPIGDGSINTISDKYGDLDGFVILFKDLSEKIAHELLVKEFEKQRLGALIEGQENERNRIARDLHDGLGQILNAIKMNVSLILSDKQTANDLSKLLDEAIQESIRISENILPSKLKDFDLATCLKSLCKQIEETVKMPINFNYSGKATEIDQTRKVNIYRVAQEALNNAIKHSKADRVDVHLTEEGSTIQLKIHDNGSGIQKVNDERGRHGIVNMKERAQIMNGRLHVSSNDASGTSVILEIPVKLMKKKHAEI